MRPFWSSAFRLSVLPAALLLLVGVAWTQFSASQPVPADEPRHYRNDEPECVVDADGTPNPDVPNLAVNCPDLFAWMTWAEINAPDANGNPSWTAWATDASTFPPQPQPDRCDGDAPNPAHCPTFGPMGSNVTYERPSKRAEPLHTREARQRALDILASGELPKDLGAAAYETVHRNRASFDYIVDNDLWYQEGMAARFRDNLQVDFPVDAIELKTNWFDLSKLEDADRVRDRFYTVETDSATWALVAMHVTTKDLPNWFWATFEHVDNPGRCDFIGCHDSYGQTPADIAPHATLDETYPAGELTPYLESTILADVPGALGQYYRLKGTQVDFTLKSGEPTLLGNSVTEHGFVQTSSCMTCHARASFDWQGKTPLAFGSRPDGQSYNGAPDPDWFFGTENQTQRFFSQLDFVWAPAKANAIPKE